MDFKGQSLATCGNAVATESWPLKKKCCNPRSYSISLRVIKFASPTLEGLLDRSLSGPPIPFESGIDFSINCSVCLVKVTVFNLCHLVSHFQKRCKVCKFALNCPVCLVKVMFWTCAIWYPLSKNAVRYANSVFSDLRFPITVPFA